MSNPLFLDKTLKWVRHDCQTLQEIVRKHVSTHLAFLRAIRGDTDVSPNADWEELQKAAVVQFGFLDAFDRGEVSFDQLRRAAYDPELLMDLATRGADSGNTSLWPARNAHDGPGTVDEFAEAWKGAIARYSTEHVSPPSLIDVNTDEAFIGHWMVSSSTKICQINAVVTNASALRLRFLDRTWGILGVRRIAPRSFRIEASTGVFLAWPPANEVRVRQAAQSAADETMDERPPIHVEATDDGIALQISTPNDS